MPHIALRPGKTPAFDNAIILRPALGGEPRVATTRFGVQIEVTDAAERRRRVEEAWRKVEGCGGVWRKGGGG